MSLESELAFALELLAECGPLALRYQTEGDLFVEHKPRGEGPVTAADRAVNERIVDGLRKRFPGDAVLAEESPESDAWRDAERCWYVDPIDGTRDYARGRAGWAVQIGLCVDGNPVLGAVGEPAWGRTYWAAKTDGAWRGEEIQQDGDVRTLAVADRARSELRLIGSKLFPFSRGHAIRRALGVARRRTTSVGSVGLRMTAVARGEADAYVQAPGRTKLWDTCAPLCLVEAAGGRVTDLRGAALSFRAPSTAHPRGVVATSGRHHDAILEQLQPLADGWLTKRRWLR